MVCCCFGDFGAADSTAPSSAAPPRLAEVRLGDVDLDREEDLEADEDVDVGRFVGDEVLLRAGEVALLGEGE